MDQNLMQQIMSDPEMMALISNPEVMNKLSTLMQDPSRAMEMMSDPDIQRIMSRISPGMMAGGMGGGMPGQNAPPPTSPSTDDLGNMVQVTATAQYNFKMKEAIAAQRPIVVDFTMNGCPPCARLKPELIRLSKQHPEILFLYVNNRQCPEIVEDMGITGFPTIVFFSTADKQLKKIDTVVGADVAGVEANIHKLNQDLEGKKKRAIFQQFSHMPLRESEIVYFKQIQWTKLVEKCQAVLTEGCDKTLYAPFQDSSNSLAENYSTPAEMLTQLSEFITFLSKFDENSMNPIKPSFIKVFNILLEWPQDHFSVPLHLFRMGCFHGDFATNIAKGGAKSTHTSAIHRVAQGGLEISSPVNGVLIARALCSIFEKRILTKTVLTAVDDLLGIISYLCLTFQDNKDVVNSSLALLLNTAYMIYLYAPTAPENLEKNKVIVQYQQSIVSTMIETLPLCIGDGQADAVYRILVALGTTFFPYFAMNQTLPDAPKSALKAHFISIAGNDQLNAWKDTFADKNNVIQAITEVQKMINGIQ